MDTLSLAKLERLPADLDLFADSPDLDPRLLELGLHPPLPLAGDLLVWGFGLCRQARRMGLPELPCRAVPPLPGGELLAMALRLEARPGRYSSEEELGMLRFVRRRREAGEEIDMAALSPLIRDRRDPNLESKIATLAALPPAVGAAAAARRLDLKTATLAANLPPGVLDLLEAARLTFSQRRRFISMLVEVSRRDRLDDGETLALGAELLQDAQPVEKLEAMRFPVLTDLRQRFALLAGRFWGSSGIRIDPPPYFEGESFAVAFQFSSPDNLSRKLRVLQSVVEQSHELFALLR